MIVVAKDRMDKHEHRTLPDDKFKLLKQCVRRHQYPALILLWLTGNAIDKGQHAAMWCEVSSLATRLFAVPATM